MQNAANRWCGRVSVIGTVLVLSLLCSFTSAQSLSLEQPEINDVHFHLTNYIQQGTDMHDFLKMMGDKVGRVAIFGIPLQQQWSYRVDANRALSYYLNTDAPLY